MFFYNTITVCNISKTSKNEGHFKLPFINFTSFVNEYVCPLVAKYVPSLFNVADILWQSNVKGLGQQEDGDTTDDSSTSKDQWWQETPDLLQHNDQRR